MPNRTLIVSMLLPAYLLLVLHSVIPHHHHTPAHHGPVQYHHGTHVHHASDDHHQPGDSRKDHDHGPTSHFVHSPDFGNAMLRSDADLEVQAPMPHLLNEMMFCLEHLSTLTLTIPGLYVSVYMTDDGKVRGQIERGPPHA